MTAVTAAAIVVLVAYVSIRRNDIQRVGAQADDILEQGDAMEPAGSPSY